MLFLNKFKMQCNGFNTFCMEIFAFVIIIFAKWVFMKKKPITLVDVLENIDFFTEEDKKCTIKSDTSILITPPNESDNDFSEEERVDEDCSEFDTNRLRRKLLSVQAQASQPNAKLKV